MSKNAAWSKTLPWLAWLARVKCINALFRRYLEVGDSLRVNGRARKEVSTTFSLPVLVNLTARANLSNDDIQALHPKKDSKISDSRRSLIVSALQRL